MIKKSTVHIHLSKDKSEYLEKAAELGGFQSLTDFFITAATEKADTIMKKDNVCFLPRMIGRFSLMQLSIRPCQMQG